MAVKNKRKVFFNGRASFIGRNAHQSGDRVDRFTVTASGVNGELFQILFQESQNLARAARDTAVVVTAGGSGRDTECLVAEESVRRYGQRLEQKTGLAFENDGTQTATRAVMSKSGRGGKSYCESS